MYRLRFVISFREWKFVTTSVSEYEMPVQYSLEDLVVSCKVVTTFWSSVEIPLKFVYVHFAILAEYYL